MSDADGLRYKKIPLNNGSDQIPALGFGTLIPDPIATKRSSQNVSGGGLSSIRLRRTLPQ